MEKKLFIILCIASFTVGFVACKKTANEESAITVKPQDLQVIVVNKNGTTDTLNLK